MFCNNCGTKNPDTVKFCSECGAKMPVATPKVAPNTTAASANDIEQKLSNLSTSNIKVQEKTASRTLNPIEDPYWDDVLPEIENEIYAIPKDNLIKIAGSIVALFAVIAWLIYML